MATFLSSLPYKIHYTYRKDSVEPISILQPTYVGCTVDNRGLYSPRMWDRNYSYTWIQIEGYEDLFLAFVFSILQGSSSGTERELLAES